MKRAVAITLFFLTIQVCFGAGLKAVIVIEDDYENSGSNNIAESCREDKRHVERFLGTLEKNNVVKVEKTIIQGRTATYSNIKKALQNVVVSPDDIILFYFAGHGAMKNNETFLSTSMINDPPLYRNEIEKILTLKKCRLKIAFSDACSVSIDDFTGNRTMYWGNRSGTEETAFVEIYRNLFLNYEGLLYITAAKEGEYAWNGFFTPTLFQETLLYSPSTEWKEIYEITRKKVMERFSQMVELGIFSESYVDSMKSKGIYTQEPKAYSLPVKKNNAKIDYEEISSYEKEKKEKGSIYIQNKLNNDFNFYIDNNTDAKKWSWSNTLSKTIKKNDLINIKDASNIYVFYYQISGNSAAEFYYLKPGNYYAAENDYGEIEIFTGLNDKPVYNDVYISSDNYIYKRLTEKQWLEIGPKKTELYFNEYKRDQIYYYLECITGNKEISVGIPIAGGDMYEFSYKENQWKKAAYVKKEGAMENQIVNIRYRSVSADNMYLYSSGVKLWTYVLKDKEYVYEEYDRDQYHMYLENIYLGKYYYLKVPLEGGIVYDMNKDGSWVEYFKAVKESY